MTTKTYEALEKMIKESNEKVELEGLRAGVHWRSDLDNDGKAYFIGLITDRLNHLYFDDVNKLYDMGGD